MSITSVFCSFTPPESLRYMNVLLLDHNVQRRYRNKNKLRVIMYYK